MEDLHNSLYSRRSSRLTLILRSMERWAQSSRTVAEHVTNLRIKQHWQQYVKKCLKSKAAYEAAKTAGEKVGSKYDPLPFGPSFSPTSQNIEPTKHKSALYTILAFCHDKRCKGFNCIITDGMMSIYPILNIDLLHNVGCDLIEIYLIYIENDLKDKGLLKKSMPKDNESKEVPWSDDDTNYMLNSEAIVKFTNSKMSLSKLTKSGGQDKKIRIDPADFKKSKCWNLLQDLLNDDLRQGISIRERRHGKHQPQTLKRILRQKATDKKNPRSQYVKIAKKIKSVGGKIHTIKLDIPYQRVDYHRNI